MPPRKKPSSKKDTAGDRSAGGGRSAGRGERSGSGGGRRGASGRGKLIRVGRRPRTARREAEVEPVIDTRGPRPGKAEVLKADDSLIIVAKPAMLPLGREEGYDDSVLHQIPAEYLVPGKAIRALDGLEADISGVCVLARTAQAESALVQQLRDGRFVRTYLAIIRGAPNEREGRIDMEIGRGAQGLMSIGGVKPKKAVTEWKLKDRFVGYALLECTAKHECKHQVRLHLRAAGLPPVVDPAYGGPPNFLLSSFKAGFQSSRRHNERPLLQRVSLHAESISFIHPDTDERVTYEMPAAKDFRAALNQLDKYGRIGMSGGA